MDIPEPLDLRSHTIAEDKRDALLKLFPEARTEGGKLDFDLLKRALGETVDAGRERYGMQWPGKADCFKAIQAPSMATLRPAPEESIDFDNTQNLIIEGDNLQVLKLLQKGYQGKVKMIYIDPPYNTGKDFIYPDNYTEDLRTYLQYTGQVDAEGRKWGSNTDTDGRFHSKWLNMMYPRLYLARNLLREDGVVFVSIGDSELGNLEKLCHDIFGEENFIASVSRVAKKTSNKGTHVAPSKDHVLVYGRSADLVPPFMDVADEEYKSRFSETDERGQYATVGLYQAALDPRPNQRYWIECPDGELVIPPGNVFPNERRDGAFVRPESNEDKVWRWSYESYFGKRNLLIFRKSKQTPLVTPDGSPAKWNIYTKYYLEDRLADGIRPRDFIDDITNDQGTNDLKALGLNDQFDFPKPVGLIERLMGWLHDKDAIVLDFFAGSGSTGQAVLELNQADGGNRKFILVQLPEPTERKDYKTIAEITKERVRRVIKKLEAEQAGKLQLEAKPDLGFRVYKLAESNFKPWDAGVREPEALVQQMQLHVQHVLEGRTEQDLLAEVMLKSGGFMLTAPVEEVMLEGVRAYDVNHGELLVCLSDALTHEALKAMATRKPQRAVCLDSGFQGNDQLKANAVQLFKAKGVVFKTV